MTYWYQSPAGQMQIETLPLSIGEWLHERHSGVVEDLFWLTDTIRSMRSHAQRKGFQNTSVPKIYMFTIPFEYEVIGFEGTDAHGHDKRFWASRTELPWPRECDFTPAED